MRLQRALRIVRKLYAARARRSYLGRTRAHIELRLLNTEEQSAFSKALVSGFADLPAVRFVDVYAELRRVVVTFAEDRYTLAELLAVVENAERSVGVHEAAFSDEPWEHPGDDETLERLVVGMAADAMGVAMGFGLRFSPLPASRLAGTLASVMSIVQTSPRLRRSLDERLGTNRADLGLSSGAALAQGLAQRPGSALVELVQKAGQLSAVRARRRVWELHEPELFQKPRFLEAPSRPTEPRPRPLPRGPIEEYADRAWVVSLGGFSVSLITTRSLQRAVAALYGGLPKPARHGREGFTAHLEGQLAGRGVLVIDREALRRLDRIDCLVLEGSLVARDRFELRGVACDPELDEAEARRLVLASFDAAHPLARKEHAGYVLEAFAPGALASSPELLEQGKELGARGGLVLSLSRAGRLLALCEVEWIPQTGIEELIAAAHEAQMRVVVASSDESALQGLSADDTISDNEGLLRGVRRLQREGRAVCVVASVSSPGLAAADCGIGLWREGETPPWGGHLLCRDDLSDVRFLIFATVAARQVAKQSVNVALGAATLGALVSAGGVLPNTARRVIAVVNAASLVSMANGARGGLSLSRRELPPPRDRTPWHALEARGTLFKLGTTEQGLSRREVVARRRDDERKRSSVGEFFEAVSDELFNPLAPLLAAGAGLSAAVGSFADAGMVGGVVVLNAVVGGVQRFRTERAIRELGRTARRRALVRRGGQLSTIDSSELARGDIVLLGPGDVVPADCRIIDEEALEVDSSSMTGESLPVKKTARASFEEQVADRASMLYEGTVLAAGRATAVVVAVGEETEARRGGVAQKRDASRGGVERRLRSLIDLTGPIAIGSGIGLIGAGLLRGRKLEDLVGSGVSLAVASVPEGLPLLATAAQLAAAGRLSAQGALVRNVRSIEALGRVDVICLDKTGTLTEGRIELAVVTDGRDLCSIEALDELHLQVLSAALRASEGPGSGSDPTDAALARSAARLSVLPDTSLPGWTRTRELPYGAGRSYHAVLGTDGQQQVITLKGAPEVLLRHSRDWRRGGELVPLDMATAMALNQHATELGRKGYRLLAVAERLASKDTLLDASSPSELVFLGFVGFRDRVRPTSARAIAELGSTGIGTVMVTGDHPSTAEAVAEEVGLLQGRELMTGSQLAELSDETLDRRIDSIGVFARVTPPQKVRVVRALQRRGRVVAMVGDGANDAPAIRLANVGIAIGERSTAAAQAAADIVLTDERIESLAHLVWEGRAMWASVRDAVSLLVGGNLGEIGFTLGAGLIDGRPPLSARQLLLVNLLTDVAPAMAIALRPPSLESLRQLAHEGPERSLGQQLNRDIVARAAVTTLGASSAWAISRLTAGHARAGTVGLVALVGTQLGQTLTSGHFSRSVVLTSLGSAGLLAGLVQTPGLSHAFGCRPLGPLGWATAITASAAATAAGNYFPGLVEAGLKKLRLDRPLFVEDLDAPPKLEV
ncbi:MAG TPA: cation-translocating P-type ATPase [Polyangiaceae bacterium]|nr:cation-translocating P-type ATPase [Polyangiaceae bacterium]